MDSRLSELRKTRNDLVQSLKTWWATEGQARDDRGEYIVRIIYLGGVCEDCERIDPQSMQACHVRRKRLFAGADLPHRARR